MAKIPVVERFQWLVPELKASQGSGNKVVIRGRALYADKTSRNLRHYVREELVKAARTLVGKPITVNHNDKMMVGDVRWAEFEDDAIEYVAEVNKEPYVTRLRDMLMERIGPEAYKAKHRVEPLRGVSVDADYLREICQKCGEKFLKGEELVEHLRSKHGVLAEFRNEPHGIIFKALSLVEPPEVPGVAGTTIELAETLRGMERLIETVERDCEEREALAKLPAAVSNESPTVLVDGRKKPEVVATAEAAEKAPQPVAPAVRGDADAPKPLAMMKELADEFKREKEQAMMFPPVQDKSEKTTQPDKVVTAPPVKLQFDVFEEPEALEKLEAVEWWGKWPSMEACVAANSDKGDPEAYCASMHGKGGGEIAPKKLTVEVSDRSIEELRHEKDHEDIRQSVRVARQVGTLRGMDLGRVMKALEARAAEDKIFAENYNGLIERVNGISASLPSIGEQVNKALESIPDYAPAIRTLEAKLAAVPDRAAEIKAVQDRVASLPDHALEISGLKENIAAIPDRGGEIKALQDSVTGLRDEVKTVRGELGERVKTWGESLEQLNKKYVEFKEEKENAEKRLKETADVDKAAKEEEIKGLKEEVQRLRTLAENTEDKVNKRGSFKGAHKVEETKPKDDDFEPFPASGRKQEAK